MGSGLPVGVWADPAAMIRVRNASGGRKNARTRVGTAGGPNCIASVEIVPQRVRERLDYSGSASGLAEFLHFGRFWVVRTVAGTSSIEWTDATGTR